MLHKQMSIQGNLLSSEINGALGILCFPVMPSLILEHKFPSGETPVRREKQG